MASLNHYDLVKWVVKPASEKRQCSFVELVATDGQPTEFYITHYFGQPVRDMLECVQHQLRIRQLGEDVLFWIWAYARQPDQSFVPDVLHTSDAFQVLRLRLRMLRTSLNSFQCFCPCRGDEHRLIDGFSGGYSLVLCLKLASRCRPLTPPG